jgi:pimeloyl-ACP methyl ester carboxylesterase
VPAQARPDGVLLTESPRPPLKAFESLDEFGRGYFSRAVYDEARAQQEFDIIDIQYSSGGFGVSGVLVQPRHLGDRQWPVIIYNRGGTGDYGRIDDLTVVDLYLLAKEGFVVIASDYRFHGPSSKRDEWGGVDVDDVLNVVPVVRSLSFVDGQRLFMLGVSRGGTMTYLAPTATGLIGRWPLRRLARHVRRCCRPWTGAKRVSSVATVSVVWFTNTSWRRDRICEPYTRCVAGGPQPVCETQYGPPQPGAG